MERNNTNRVNKISNAVQPFRVYNYVEVYQQRREYRLKKVEQEDRQKRKCIAKPMPDFSTRHIRAVQSKNIAVTVPETPEVLKRGIAMMSKLKQKQQEYERKLAERQPIVARMCNVIRSKPFKPKLETKVTSAEPFNLKMSERLVGRVQHNEEREKQRILQRELNEKKRQEDEERIRKTNRERTVFKARQNPFK